MSAAKLATYEYKSLYGSTWALLSTFDYKAAEIAGTTILIHECQSANPSKPVGVDVKVKIKAAGGISSFDDAERFIELGADRLGTSRLIKLVKK